MEQLKRLATAAVFVLGVCGGLPQNSYAQPIVTAPDRASFVGNWRITATLDSDADDYWLIVQYPDGRLRWVKDDEETLKVEVFETGTWTLFLQIEDTPNDCEEPETSPPHCLPATILSLNPEAGSTTKYRLHARTDDTESDAFFILEPIGPPLVLSSPNPNFGSVPLFTQAFSTLKIKNVSDATVHTGGAVDCANLFTVVDNIPYDYMPGEEKTFQVVFHPKAADVGPKSCAIQLIIVPTGDRTAPLVFTGTGVSATSPPPPTSALSVSLGASSFTAGQTMTLTAALTPLTTPTPVDAYVAVQLPTGQFFSVQPGGGLVPGIVPIARGIVPVPFTGTLAQYAFTGAEPRGTYTWYTALTQPGTLNVVGTIQQTTFTVP